MNTSNFSTTPNFDNLLLQTLMNRLQIRPPPLHAPPSPFSGGDKSLEELLFSDMLLNQSESDSESDNMEISSSSSSSKTLLAKEEAKLEKEIIRTILSGEIEKLKPNSGQAVSIGENHICVGFHEETGSDYRVWEWHGHVILFDEEEGYTPEYIYGNYFEKAGAVKKAVVEKKEKKESVSDDDENGDKVGNMGLKELIGAVELEQGRILHRNLNAGSGSTRF